MDVLNRTVCGVLGGVVGVLAMRAYWKAATAIMGEDPREKTRSGPPRRLDDISVVGEQHKEGESASAAVGRLAYAAVTGHEPESDRLTTRLSQGVHWSFGLGMGALYGALRGSVPGADLSGGVLYGTGIWALGSETAVPLLGLADGPTAAPIEQHIHGIFAHLVYGLATTTTTQALIGRLERNGF